MIQPTYKENKKIVLDLYKEYCDLCKNYNFSIEKSIENQAEKISNEIFNLMVIGEAKSGKSTFINAYLGKEVLPMDVRQCTSAIIEIQSNENCSLMAETAGGELLNIESEESVSAFLSEHAAIQDEYREIPVTTINNNFIIPSKGNFNEVDIKAFLADPDIRNNNIYNLPVEQYETIIRNYIEDIRKKWQKIITKISIKYPLPDAMKGIRIIDSPGVGAGGNVGQIANDYINNANAILFVKALSGQALESSSFRDFFNSNCREKNKAALFLVFTRIADLTGDELNKIKKQAIEMYRQDIQEEKILFVDSKSQLFLNKCRELNTEENIDEYFSQLKKTGNKYNPVQLAWYENRDNVPDFFDSLETLSNFETVPNVLEKFAQNARYIQLGSLLSAICKDYEGKKLAIEGFIKQLEANLDVTPEILSEKIKEKKREMNQLYEKITNELSKVRLRFADVMNENSIIRKEAKKKGEKYKNTLKSYSELTDIQIEKLGFSKVANELKTKTFDAIDETAEFQKTMGQRLIKECDEILISIGKDKDGVHLAPYKPNFTESDFDDLDKSARNQTEGDIEHPGVCFSDSWTEHYHHLQKHISMMVTNIFSRLDNSIIPAMQTSAVQYVDALLQKYKEKLTEKSAELERQYKDLSDRLKGVQDNTKLLEEYQKKYKEIYEKAQNVKNIYMEVLQNYVKQ